jgi:MYXO-CTERM domain-containing protein
MARRSFALAACAAAPILVALAATPAHAHFVLKQPPAYSEQDFGGGPQKSAPCGQADPGQTLVLTNDVTTFQAGSTIDITFDEMLFHPGHYRVLLAPTPEALPADPPVTADSDSACGSTVITQNPTLPLLADGLLVHDTMFNGTQTMHVTLPAGMTCTNCTLQVVEFMSHHPLNNPGGCFYHHCATVNVTAGPVPDAGPNDADAAPGTGTGADAGHGTGGNNNDGGGCAIGTGRASNGAGAAFAGLALLGLIALAARRRRRV